MYKCIVHMLNDFDTKLSFRISFSTAQPTIPSNSCKFRWHPWLYIMFCQIQRRQWGMVYIYQAISPREVRVYMQPYHFVPDISPSNPGAYIFVKVERTSPTYRFEWRASKLLYRHVNKKTQFSQETTLLNMIDTIPADSVELWDNHTT